MKLQHEEKVKDLAPSEEVRRPHILLLKGTSAFLQHVLWEQGLHILPIAPLLHQNEGIRTSTFCSGQALLLTFLLPSLFNPKEKRGGSEDN